MKKQKLGIRDDSMVCPPVVALAEIAVYTSWAEILTRMAYCSVGIDLQTVVQEKMPPVVAEAGFTPLDISYLKRESDRKVG